LSSFFQLLLRLRDSLLSRYRNVLYRLLGVQIDGYCWLRRIHIPRLHHLIHLHRGCSLDRNVTLQVSGDHPKSETVLSIGKYSYINRHSILDAHHQLTIGEKVMIGPHCYLSDSEHSYQGKEPVSETPMNTGSLHIEDEVWIGSHVVILSNVRIGKGAVIGAGSVVTKDIPPYSIAYGSPAKVQAQR